MCVCVTILITENKVIYLRARDHGRCYRKRSWEWLENKSGENIIII